MSREEHLVATAHMLRVRALWDELVVPTGNRQLGFDRWYYGAAHEAGLHKQSMHAIRQHIRAHFVDALPAYAPCRPQPPQSHFVSSHDGAHQFTNNDVVKMKNSGNVYMLRFAAADKHVFGIGLDGSVGAFLPMVGNCLLHAEPYDCL